MNEQKGTVKVLRHESEILKNNPLGDKFIRDLYVYLPPDYENEPDKIFPVVYNLTGFTGRGKMLFRTIRRLHRILPSVWTNSSPIEKINR